MDRQWPVTETPLWCKAGDRKGKGREGRPWSRLQLYDWRDAVGWFRSGPLGGDSEVGSCGFQKMDAENNQAGKMTINPPLELSRWVGGSDAIKCMNGKKTVLFYIWCDALKHDDDDNNYWWILILEWVICSQTKMVAVIWTWWALLLLCLAVSQCHVYRTKMHDLLVGLVLYQRGSTWVVNVCAGPE